MYVLLLIDAALRSGPAKYGRKGCDRSNPSSHNLTSTCSLSLPCAPRSDFIVFTAQSARGSGIIPHVTVVHVTLVRSAPDI